MVLSVSISSAECESFLLQASNERCEKTCPRLMAMMMLGSGLVWEMPLCVFRPLDFYVVFNYFIRLLDEQWADTSSFYLVILTTTFLSMNVDLLSWFPMALIALCNTHCLLILRAENKPSVPSGWKQAICRACPPQEMSGWVSSFPFAASQFSCLSSRPLCLSSNQQANSLLLFSHCLLPPLSLISRLPPPSVPLQSH